MRERDHKRMGMRKGERNENENEMGMEKEEMKKSGRTRGGRGKIMGPCCHFFIYFIC